MILSILKDFCLIVGGLVLLFIFYSLIIYPICKYLKSQYMYYIKHSAFEYDKTNLVSFFFPHGEYVTFEEYKKKWGYYPKKIAWYKFKCYNPW